VNKLALKTLARSRSLRLARDVDALERGEWGGEAVHEVPWRTGDGRPVAYRPGSSDVGLVYAILFKPARKSEYWLPPEVAPRTIFDIGANIGITARYLAHRFPDAAIHAFEPIAANLELLRRNVAGCNVTVHPYGLGAADGAAEFGVPAGAPDNRGGYSRFAGAAATSVVRAELRSVGGVLDALRLDSVDVVKIDTEGAEYDILSAFPAAALARTRWIYGELHGAVDGAASGFRALDLLAPWFDIEVRKPLRKRNFFFDACNRRLAERVRGFRRGRR